MGLPKTTDNYVLFPRWQQHNSSQFGKIDFEINDMCKHGDRVKLKNCIHINHKSDSMGTLFQQNRDNCAPTKTVFCLYVHKFLTQGKHLYMNGWRRESFWVLVISKTNIDTATWKKLILMDFSILLLMFVLLLFAQIL